MTGLADQQVLKTLLPHPSAEVIDSTYILAVCFFVGLVWFYQSSTDGAASCLYTYVAASLLTNLSPQRRLTIINNNNSNNDDDDDSNNKLNMAIIKGFNVIRKCLGFQRRYKVTVALKKVISFSV